MDEIHGSLISQAEKVIDTLYLKYLKAYISYEGVTRVETYPYPKDAIREAVYNAIAHKSYHTQIPIQIRVQDDENLIYIGNSAVLPPDWTAETFMKHHQSNPYNPSIANAFFRAGYAEAWGRGIEKICENCIKYGVSLPEYSVKPYEVIVKFKGLEVNNEMQSTKAPIKRQSTAGIGNEKVLGDRERQIIELITVNPEITQEEIAHDMRITRRVVQKSIQLLVKNDFIVRIGGKRFGRWKIVNN